MAKRVKKRSVKLAPRQVDMARMIAKQFPNVSCTALAIRNWQRRDLPFPMPNARGSYVIQDCFDWVEKYIANKGDQSELKLLDQAVEAKAKRTINQAAREKFELEKEMGLYIYKADAKRDIASFAKLYHGIVKQEVSTSEPELLRDKLKEFGVSPEIVAVIYTLAIERAAEFISRIESRCQKESQ